MRFSGIYQPFAATLRLFLWLFFTFGQPINFTFFSFFIFIIIFVYRLWYSARYSIASSKLEFQFVEHKHYSIQNEDFIRIQNQDSAHLLLKKATACFRFKRKLFFFPDGISMCQGKIATKIIIWMEKTWRQLLGYLLKKEVNTWTIIVDIFWSKSIHFKAFYDLT